MATKLLDSLGAIYHLLERPRIARRAIAVLLVTHTFLLGYSAYVHSPTFNEPAHLVAGLSHCKLGRFDIYNVNPPLVRIVAAVPVMVAGYEEDWSGFYLGPGSRMEFSMGEAFVKANGDRSFFLFMIARWACIPFSWIGAITCYLWARDLYGRSAGIAACAIWSFEPNILAHASLATPDAHATALGLAACYTFWRWLKKPTWRQAAITGVILGLAELAKTTMIIIFPLWPLLWVYYRWPERATTPWFREAGMLAVRMTIGLYVLNFGYGFEGSFQQLGNQHFVSRLFTGEETDNRFAGSWLGALPVPLPKNYLLGIDTQQRDFENYGRPSYFRGQWSARGWWYYYIYACAIKVPLGLWLLGLTVIVSRIFIFLRPNVGRRHLFNFRQTPQLRDEIVLISPATIIFLVVSSKTGFSEHMRYVLPGFPFLFVYISQIFGDCSAVPTKWRYDDPPEVGTHASRPTKVGYVTFLLTTFALSFIVWMISSSLWIYPHSLSYFNEFVGGPLNGAKHLLGSNVDWGQGLRYVKSWDRSTSETKSNGEFHLAYFGPCNPSDVGINDALPVSATVLHSGNKGNLQLRMPRGLYVVSANLLGGYPETARDSGGGHRLNPLVCRKLLELTPVGRFGYSLLLFELPKDTESKIEQK